MFVITTRKQAAGHDTPSIEEKSISFAKSGNYYQKRVTDINIFLLF